MWLMVDGNSLVTYLWFRNPNNNVAEQMWMYIADTMVTYSLSHVAVAWDQNFSKGKRGAGSVCRRRQQYEAYKGNRSGSHPQWAIARPRVMHEVKESLRELPVVQGSLDGLEADDVLWCWTQMVKGLIISGDEDLLQCCNDDVMVWSPRKKEVTGIQQVKERYGSVQAMLVQKALVGDTSDNIIGVSGIGKNRARDLWMEKSEKLLALLEGANYEDEEDKWLVRVIEQVDTFRRNWRIIKLGEIINAKDMQLAESFLFQQVKFDVNNARHYAASMGWHEIIRKWNQIAQAYQKALP